MKTISYASNQWGYFVQVCDDGKIIEEYHAGNHQRDSQLTVPLNSPNVVKPAKLLQMARQTAKEMAVERGIAKKDVQYDSDLHRLVTGRCRRIK